MSLPDLTGLTDDDLDRLRIDLLAERERRARIAQAPAQIAAAITDALAVGVDAAVIQATIDNAMEA